MNIVEISRHQPTMVVYIILTVSLLFATLVVPFGGDLIRQKIVQRYQSRRASEIWDIEQRSSPDSGAPRKYQLGEAPKSPRIQPIGAQPSSEYCDSGITSQLPAELGCPRREEPSVGALLGEHITTAFKRPTVKAIDLAVAPGQEARLRHSRSGGLDLEASTTASIRSATTRAAEDEWIVESPWSKGISSPPPIHPGERGNFPFEYSRDVSPSRKSTSTRVPSYPGASAENVSVEKSQTLVHSVVDKVFHGTRTGEATKDDSSGWRKGKISMQRHTSVLRAKLQAQQRARKTQKRRAKSSPEATSTRGETDLETEPPESGIGFETPKTTPRLRLLCLSKNGPSTALETKKFWVPRKEIATWKKLKSVVIETVHEYFPEAYDDAENDSYEVWLNDAIVLERFWEAEMNDPALVQEPVYIRVNSPQNAGGDPGATEVHSNASPLTLSRAHSLPELVSTDVYERVEIPQSPTKFKNNPSKARRTSDPQNLTSTSASRDLSRADEGGDYIIAISALGHPKTKARRSSVQVASSTGRSVGFRLRRSNTETMAPAPGAATSLMNPGASFVFI